MKRLIGSALLVSLLGAPFAASATPVLVLDADSHEVLAQEDAGVPWYPASTTKLMTAFLTFEALREGRITLSTPVTMTKKSVSEAFLESGLSQGQAMTLEDALYAMIVASANDVAMAVAETVGHGEAPFVEKMNEAAKRLGMTGTHFSNPNGLFDKNNYTTARDLAILGLAIEQQFPQFQNFFQVSAVSINGKEIPSNNLLLTRYRGTTGLKTGFLCASGRNFVGVAQRDNRRLMVVVLGATTERERNERSAKYLTEGFEGRLSPSLGRVEAIANRPDVKPEDMRLRLCTKQSEQYEATREAMYPMGLPGQPSYLNDEIPGIVHRVTTWQNEAAAADMPVPSPRPIENPVPRN